MKTIRHVVWDWNGTLLDDTEACVQAINRILERRRLPRVTVEQYRDIFGFPVKDYYLALGFDFSVENWDRLAREYHDIYEETSRSASLRPGILDVLTTLRNRGMPMSILSACEESILDRMLKERGVRDFFPRIYGLTNLFAGSKVEQGHRLLAHVGLPPAEILLIGDTLHDREVADALGCACLLLPGGHQSAHRLVKTGCPMVADPRGIPARLYPPVQHKPAHEAPSCPRCSCSSP